MPRRPSCADRACVVDAVYDKLFSYDCTKRHFVPQQSGYRGPIPADIEGLHMDHEMIQFRKAHLGRYLASLVTRPYDAKMIGYLDMVGKMHTPAAGSVELDVPLVQMNALMGFVADAVLATVLSLGLDCATEVRTLAPSTKCCGYRTIFIMRDYQAKPALQLG